MNAVSVTAAVTCLSLASLGCGGGGNPASLDTGHASVSVCDVRLQDLACSIIGSDLRLGETAPFNAIVRESAFGGTISCSITWSSENPAVATVSGGLVTGVGVGSTRITATAVCGAPWGTVTGSRTVRVVPA